MTAEETERLILDFDGMPFQQCQERLYAGILITSFVTIFDFSNERSLF